MNDNKQVHKTKVKSKEVEEGGRDARIRRRRRRIRWRRRRIRRGERVKEHCDTIGKVKREV